MCPTRYLRISRDGQASVDPHPPLRRRHGVMLIQRLRPFAPGGWCRNGMFSLLRLWFQHAHSPSRGTSTIGNRRDNIERTGNSADRVYGVLFSIAESDADVLDGAEGLGHGYRKGEVEVVTPQGTTQAVAYFATRKDTHLVPYHWYKDLVMQGAIEHALPMSHIEKLRAIRSQPDLDAGRRARNEALLLL